jgi:N-acyl-D-amino-acid deacylase
MFDLIITGGTVIDGTRRPRLQADVAIERGRIHLLAPRTPAATHDILDAAGLTVAPGFIDIRTHSDWGILYDPQADARLTQGVTTEVIGTCGYSAAPLADSPAPPGWIPPKTREILRRSGIEPDWRDYGGYLERVEAVRPAVNIVPAVGHNTIRSAVMGPDDRAPAPGELDRMCALVRDAMEAGGFALSTGLIHAPGRFASTEEIEALCRVVAHYGGRYDTHVRSETDHLLDAIDEAIGIARRTGVKLEIAHLKALGARQWGKIGEAIGAIEAAWARGVAVGVDAYPYTVPGATQSGLRDLLPPSLAALSDQAFGVLDDETSRARAAVELEHTMANGDGDDRTWLPLAGGPGRVVLTRSGDEAHAELLGMTFEEIADRRGVAPARAMIDVACEARGRGSVVLHLMNEDDVAAVMKSTFVGVGSDGRVGLRQDLPAGVLPHPRSYGTFPRVIARYARDRGILSMEEAIWKMTGLNAERLGLRDRGRVIDGCWADLVVFDPEMIEGRATYDRPWAATSGIRWLLVNGEIAVDHGRLTGVRSGRVLRR